METDKHDHISAFFQSKFPFNHEGLAEFSSAFVVRHYPKGTILSLAEEAEDQLSFLEEGIIREYYSHNGKEMNTWFYLSAEFITDFSALLKGGKRKKYQECLADSTIRVMDRRTFFSFMERYQCGREFVNEIFAKMIANREDESFKHFSLTPDELYLDLLAKRPQWLRVIPLYHIATYLRMTPETLSRIRKRN